MSQVGALVLAAGLSRRMGTAKLGLCVNGQPMLSQSLAAARAADLPILIVTGAHRDVVEGLSGDCPVVHAARHAEGIAHSLAAGVASAPPQWDSLLVILADMPFVSASTLRLLASRLRQGASAVVPVFEGQRGNPGGFARRHWPVLLALEGDRGAGGLLDCLGVEEVAVDDPGILRDFDRPEDF